MKVLYVYPSNRNDLLALYERHEAPENLLYFLPALRRAGVEAVFEDVHADDLLFKAVRPFQELCIHYTGAGFKLDQALKLARAANRSDVVVATADSSALPLLLLKKLGVIRVPVVVLTIGLYDNLMKRRSLPFLRAYASLYRAADRIVSFSGRLQLEKLAGLLGLGRDRLVSLPLCVDTGFYRPTGVTGGDFIISVGRDPMRDYPALFALARKLSVPFKVLTSPWVIKGLEVPPNVEVLFDHPMRATVDELCKSRFHLHLSRPNTYLAGHTTLLAAMACGKLAVFNDEAPDLPFRDMENCVILREGEDAAARVRSLLDHPDEVARIARAGYELVTTCFHQDVAARQLKELLTEVTAPARPG